MTEDRFASDAAKCRCIDQQLEMSAAAVEFWLTRLPSSYAPSEYAVEVRLRNKNKDLIKFMTRSASLIDATAEAYDRFTHYTRALPDFEGRDLIEHVSVPVGDDEIPF